MENILKIPLDDCTDFTLSLALLRDVKNSRSVKEKVMNGQLQCCIIKANLIVDPFQITVAANKAALSHEAGTGVTKSVYTEILFNLSISKNISQSLMMFGVGDRDQDVVVAVMTKNSGLCNIVDILDEIDGVVSPFESLNEVMDEKLICKTYKIGQCERSCTALLDSIISRIATTDFVSH